MDSLLCPLHSIQFGLFYSFLYGFSKLKFFPFHIENLSNFCRHKYDHLTANFTKFPILFLACFGHLEPLCAGLDRGSPGKNGRSTRAGLAQSGLRMVAHHFELSDLIGTWLLTWLNLLTYLLVDSQRIYWPKNAVQGNTFPVKIDKLLNFPPKSALRVWKLTNCFISRLSHLPRSDLAQPNPKNFCIAFWSFEYVLHVLKLSNL